MRSTTIRTPEGLREERQQRIAHFITTYLDTIDDARLDAVLIVARSALSPVAQAVMTMAAALVARGLEARMILGQEHGEPEGMSACDSMDSLVREVRILRDPRLLESHEQLVLGAHGVWFGDSMRRDPLHRDAFESFSAYDDSAARRARAMFERLWQLTLPVVPHAVGLASTATATVVRIGRSG